MYHSQVSGSPTTAAHIAVLLSICRGNNDVDSDAVFMPLIRNSPTVGTKHPIAQCTPGILYLGRSA